MRRPLRIILFLAGAASILIVALFVYVSLVATDRITSTKKTQSIELPGGQVLQIYRTSKWEYYDCQFELRERRSGNVIIPRTHFDSTTYWSFKSEARQSTPEHRTTYAPLIGIKSCVIGLVSSEDTETVLLLVDTANSEFFAQNPLGLEAADKERGERLLEALKKDYPGRDLAIPGTRGAAMQKRKHDIEHFREAFARIDASIKLGTTYSNALAVSWTPIAVVTNGNGITEAQFQAEPSFTWLGPINDTLLTNGFSLVVSNGVVIGKRYLSTVSY